MDFNVSIFVIVHIVKVYVTFQWTPGTKGLKSLPSQQLHANGVVLVSLLLSLNIFHTLF